MSPASPAPSTTASAGRHSLRGPWQRAAAARKATQRDRRFVLEQHRGRCETHAGYARAPRFAVRRFSSQQEGAGAECQRQRHVRALEAPAATPDPRKHDGDGERDGAECDDGDATARPLTGPVDDEAQATRGSRGTRHSNTRLPSRDAGAIRRSSARASAPDRVLGIARRHPARERHDAVADPSG